jgi:multicomponent Na+:H+ antiporter subunit C
MIYSLCLVLILIGFYGVVASRQTLKIVISLLIMQHGVHLLLLLVGYRTDGSPPIVDSVIGLGVLALMVAICVRLYERYGTFDVTEIRRLRG